jgi:cytochrome c
MYSRRDVHAWLHHRAFLIGALSGMACMLASPSALPQASQGMGGVSGEQAFNNACRTCHTVKQGDNRLGPNLHKIVGRKAGSLPDYAFSSAMKEAGFVWDEEKLDRFIAKPDEVVAGNNMKPYGGLSSSDDRKKIITFLAQQP